MTMSRNESLTMLQKASRWAGVTAAEFLANPGHYTDGLAIKDLDFFKRHRSEPVGHVARACANGRVWPGDTAIAARKLWV